MKNAADPRVSPQNDAVNLEHQEDEWTKKSTPARELPVLMTDTPHEIFYDAREVYGGY